MSLLRERVLFLWAGASCLKGRVKGRLGVLGEATRRRQCGMAWEQEGSSTPWPLTEVWARCDQWDSVAGDT